MLLANRVTVQNEEIAALGSPDGAADAVLIDIPRDAHGAHSAKVCLRRSMTLANSQLSCNGVAYLSGVSASDRNLGIHLEWQSSTELAIRYQEATTVYLYYSTFIWPNSGRRFFRGGMSLTPIHVKLVRTDVVGKNRGDVTPDPHSIYKQVWNAVFNLI
jgi:hypothetical protein